MYENERRSFDSQKSLFNTSMMPRTGMIRPDARSTFNFNSYSPEILRYRTPRPSDDHFARRSRRNFSSDKTTNPILKWPAKMYNQIKEDKLILARFFVKSIFFIVFVGYAFFQAIQLLISFAQNPVEISLEIQTPTNLTIPAVSVCFEYNLNNEKLSETIETRKKVSASTQADPTVEVIINTTPSVDDLVESCLVLNGNIKQVKCSELSNVRQFITKKNKCFTWFSYGSWKLPENETKATYGIRAIKNKEWLLIKLKNLTMIKNDIVGIGIHENHVPIVPDLADPQFTEVIRTWYSDALVSRVTLTYEASSMSRLPSPYPSKCIDYKSSKETVAQILDKLKDESVLRHFDRSGHLIATWMSTVYSSHRELIDSCIGYLYSARSDDHWPSLLLASEKQQKDFFVSYASSSKLQANITENILQAANERRLCNRLFPFPECNEVTYTIQIKTTHYDDTDTMEIALYAPTGTQMHMKQVPKYESREIIAVISGIFSFWVGISAVSLLTPIAPFLAKILTKMTSSSTNSAPISGNVSSAYQQRLPFYVDWSTGENRHGYGSVINKAPQMQNKKLNPPLHTYSVNWG